MVVGRGIGTEHSYDADILAVIRVSERICHCGVGKHRSIFCLHIHVEILECFSILLLVVEEFARSQDVGAIGQHIISYLTSELALSTFAFSPFGGEFSLLYAVTLQASLIHFIDVAEETDCIRLRIEINLAVLGFDNLVESIHLIHIQVCIGSSLAMLAEGIVDSLLGLKIVLCFHIGSISLENSRPPIFNITFTLAPFVLSYDL